MNKFRLILLLVTAFGFSKTTVTGFDDPHMSRSFDSDNFVFNAISVDMENNGMLVSHRLWGHAGMEWPVGSDKYIDFASGIWFAGKVDDVIRTAVAEYAPEFVPGTIGSDPLNEINRIFYVSVSDLSNPSNSPDIIDWPWSEGAPWVDANNDGVYNIDDGDLPEMHGDFMIWYVMNDGDADTHSNIFGTLPLDLEISVLQWGYYGMFDDHSLQNMIFTKVLYKNMSDEPIEDMYFSIWDDPDLGFAGDDYVGCDTTLSLGYCYNDGTDDDYGYNPPAIGRILLQGPMVESVGDTAMAFGELYPGYRNLPMTSFVKYINGDQLYSDPNDAAEAYNYMSGYTGDGSPFIDSSTGLPSHFVDPCDPNDNLNSSDDCWVDSDDNASGDRRYLLSSGPVIMPPNDIQEIVFATVISQGDNALNSVADLFDYSAIARQFYTDGFAGSTEPEFDHFEISNPVILADNLNHDGFWNNGETVLIDFTVNNPTGQTLTQTITLFTTNPQIQIIDENSMSVTIAPYGQVNLSDLNLSPYITIDENYDLSTAELTVSVQDANNGIYFNNFSFPVYQLGFPPEVIWADHIEGNSDAPIGYIIVDYSQLLEHEYEVFFAEYDSVFTYLNTGEADDLFLRSRDTVSVLGINLMDMTTGELVLEDHPIPDTYGFDMPVTQGFKLYVDPIMNGIHGVWQTSNGNGPISGVDENEVEDVLWIHFLNSGDYPTEQAQGGWVFVTHGGGTPNDMESFLHRVFRGSNYSRAIPNDFEIRFTAEALVNGMGYRRFEDNLIIGNVPFELWNLGPDADDTSDDFRMLPAILNGAGLGAADDNIDAFDFWGDDPNSSGDDDPASDWIYWGNPDNMSPGQAGYDEFFAPGIGNAPAGGWTEVMARTRLMNWNRYLGGGGSPLDSASAELAMPEVGTTLRLITNKTIGSDDRYRFSTQSAVILGCTDPEASNYDPDANVDDGSCEYYLSGDLNSDTNLDILDVVILVTVIMGETNPSEYQLIVGDFNNDGDLNVLDIVSLVNCIMTDCWL